MSRYYLSYFTEEKLAAIAAYKYHGSDQSLLYNNVLSPLYTQFLEAFVPMWIAPNAVTLAGFIVPLIAHCIYWYYCPLLFETGPSWVHVFAGVGTIFYHMMDALDGKQARRTGSSSPLGLLFDHCCDALNATVMAMSLACCLQVGVDGGYKTAVVWLIGALPFFIGTWEQYYVGSLALPMINGPTEGVYGTAALFLATGLVLPTDFWLGVASLPSVGPVRYHTIFLFAAGASALATVGVNFWNVTHAVKYAKATVRKVEARAKRKESEEASGGSRGRSGSVDSDLELPFFQASYVATYTRLGVFFWVVCSAAFFIASTNIMERHPRMVMWTLGLLLSKLVTGIMIAHMASCDYHPYGRTVAAVAFLCTHASILLFYDRLGEFEVTLIVAELLVVCGCSYLHMSVRVIGELCDYLGIECFTIAKRSE